ncbi:uncharacterized protein LOC121785321 [Salvia splendens]|uniref:uncharacterized protein LOC121785321 n=1 Tax=Salvia splendens TaxID=180675 RepID=UPI001C268728|nr:uncharacterized protein LOC121785321 [Salvia splendens]
MEEGSRTTMFLSSCRKNLVVQFLLKHSIDGVLTRGAVMEAAEEYGISRKTVYRLWNKAKQQMQRGEPAIMEGKVKGYHHSDKFSLDEEKVRALSTLERSSIRKMAHKLSVSKSTLGQWIKEAKLRPHTNAIKPALTDANKLARLKWCLSKLEPHINACRVQFESMHNVVHNDEKWFYMTKTSDRYYLLPDEVEPYRACKSKRFITKVMFMCAVTQRKSKNRAKGTLETKPISSVNKSVMRDCIINRIVPAIKAKWPEWASKEIYIQQDNATPHINGVDAEFEAACLTEIMVFRGGNNYKVPHINKARSERTVGLPNALDVDEDLVRDVLEYLQQPENNAGCGYDIMALANAFGF